MTQKDMEAILADIQYLTGVVVVTLPECLLYSTWQRPGEKWDVEAAGAYLGQVMQSNNEGMRSVDRASTVTQITIELDTALIIVMPAREYQFAVAYLFENGTPMGWARLNIDRTLADIDASLGSKKDVAEAKKAAAQSDAGQGRTEPAAAAAAKPATPAPAAPAPAPKPAAPAPAAKPAAPAPAAKPAAPAAAAKPATPGPTRPRATTAKPIPSTASKSSSPSIKPPATGASTKPASKSSTSSPAISTSSASSSSTKPPAKPAAGAADKTSATSTADKAKKLMNYLGEKAPDTHAALMRVSLQTGLSLNRLNSPESLSDDEYNRVEESVRRILGVDTIEL